VRLRALLDGVEVTAATGTLDVEVTGVAHDSRRVRPGDAFFALAGAHHDGARFVRDAIGAGAGAIVAGPGVVVEGVPHVAVAEPRLALARAACVLHGDPSRAMRVAAVTGTNGKTTTTWMLESVFTAAGWRSGVIGTTGVRFGGVTRPSAFTTPEAPELQALLAEMRDAGVRVVTMEVSSHALVQRRAWGLATDVCVFTNLTQDHLDFHHTMEAYLDAKLMLFDGRNGGAGKPATAVIDADDPAAPRVEAAARRGGMTVRTFSAEPARAEGGFDVHVTRLDTGERGLALEVAVRAGDGARLALVLTLPMLGRYNAANAAGVIGAAIALGISPEAVVRGLEALPGVPGRLERVETGRRFAVVVDYAHTPDALERALAAVREHFRGRVLVVFGCGGDRDAAKRPLMGRVAAESADRVWITNDNPRGEDPAVIAAAIEGGARAAHRATPRVVELDRRAAIAAALAAARAGDVVLIAGKGHETTQTIAGVVMPFDDRVVARQLLAPDAARGGA